MPQLILIVCKLHQVCLLTISYLSTFETRACPYNFEIQWDIYIVWLSPA